MAHEIHIFINKKQFVLDNPVQTGASLKQLAGIPLSDVLFLQQPHEDEVIPNDKKITLKDGDHLHSQPPADYGLQPSILSDAGLEPARVSLHEQPDGWCFLVIAGYELPAGFQPSHVELLIKLPPAFPDAAPDMFWVFPAVRTAAGNLPRATSDERLLDRTWQRFSWHLVPGTWRAGMSDLRDFLRCVQSRFLRAD